MTDRIPREGGGISGTLFFLQGIGPFHQSYQIYGYRVVFLYYLFNVCGVSCDILSVIPDIGHLCLSFLLVSLARSLSILLVFSKMILVYLIFFQLLLCFQMN